MRPRISIRGCVRPSVRRSVGPSVRNAFVKIAENGVMQDEGASRAMYPALFLYGHIQILARTFSDQTELHSVCVCVCEFSESSVNFPSRP